MDLTPAERKGEGGGEGEGGREGEGEEAGELCVLSKHVEHLSLLFY